MPRDTRTERSRIQQLQSRIHKLSEFNSLVSEFNLRVWEFNGDLQAPPTMTKACFVVVNAAYVFLSEISIIWIHITLLIQHASACFIAKFIQI